MNKLTGGVEHIPFSSHLRFIFYIFIITSSIILPLSALDSHARSQDNTLVRVGFFDNQPVSFRTGSEDDIGIAFDVLEHVAVTMDLELDIQKNNRDTVISKLRSGELDMIACIETPCEDIEGLLLSNETLISNWGEIFEGEGQDIGSVMDLQDKWIGVVKDDLYYNGRSGLKNMIESFEIDAKMVEFDNHNEVLDAIETGNVDAGCLNNLLGISVEGRREIFRTGVIYNPIDIRFAFNSNSTLGKELQGILDRELKGMKEDDESIYYSSLERYIDEKSEPSSNTFIPWWVPRAILILLLVVVILVIMTVILRVRIRMRTRELRETNTRLDKDIKRRMRVERNLEMERNRSVFYLDLLIHDIGNIHHGLVSTMQLYDMVKEDRAKADRTQERAKGLIERSINLIRNVRKYTEATTKPIEPQPLDLKELVERSIESVSLSFPEKKISIKKDITPSPITVVAEPLLEEVFFNIMHNAVKYSNDNEPIIEVGLRRSEAGAKAAVSIGDFGRGISDEMKNELFHRPLKAHELKHTGMGLSLVKALLDRYDGDIQVMDRDEEDYRKGTIFTVFLPIEKSKDKD